MYKNSQNGSSVIRLSDGAYIPKDPSNRDFQAVQEWVNSGNQIAAADPVETPPETSKLDGLSNSKALGLLIDAIKDKTANGGILDLKLSDVEARADAVKLDEVADVKPK